MLDGFDTCPMEDINIDLDPDRTLEYGVRGIPTLVLIDSEGKELWRKTGLVDKVQLEAVVRTHEKNRIS